MKKLYKIKSFSYKKCLNIFINFVMQKQTLFRKHIDNLLFLDFKISLDELNLTSVINSRVKALNSIEFKINSYMSEKHNNGEEPINKCFNDLYGIRIILNDSITYDKIKEFVKNRYGRKLKCIDSSKEEYVATHIYFKKDNFCYQWELQIWDKEHENSNIISHEKYKQDYIKWEKENKGGESF